MTEPLRCDLSAVDLFSSAQTTEDTGEYSRGGTGRPFSTPLTVHLSAASTQIHTEVSSMSRGHVPSRQDRVRERLADRCHAFHASRE